MNPVEKLFDENNNDNIILYTENGEAIEFEQIAVIYLGDEPYALLHPAITPADMEEDEALVFEIVEIDGEECLQICDDDEVVDAVFEEYYELLREAGVDV